ncbi:MAG: Na+/solute symporter [Chitinophagaceae bacterium]|nr:MAG: Na+/solute [Chitinophagaceae bacterium]TXT30181.1 MAG: Na+/solute symporter [Chitinophagaceae bacterium]
MNQIASNGMVTAILIALLIYMGTIIFFVVRGAMNTHSMKDFALGSMHFSPSFLGLSLAASMSSAATFIINPGFVAYYGVSGFLSMAICLPIGTLVSLAILSRRFRKYGQTVNARTIAQWMGIRYQSKGFALFFGFLSLLMLAFIVMICVGLTQVIARSLNLEILPTLIGVVAFTFTYMMFGGANSMVYTNTVQAFLKLIVAIILITSGYEYFAEGVTGFLGKLAAIDPMLAKPFNPNSPIFRDFFEVVICQLIVGVAIVCQPHILTRSLLLKDDKDLNRFLTVAILAQALFFMVVFAGLYARLQFPDLKINGTPIPLDGVMGTFVVSRFPIYIAIVLFLGMISAGMATLEGLIQSLSTTFTSDIIKPLTGNSVIKSLDRTGGFISELAMNRIVIALMAVAAIYMSYEQLTHPDLSVGIFAQNGVYAYFCGAFVPVLFGIFTKDCPPIAAIVSSVTAVVVHFSVYYGRLTPYMHSGTRNPGVSAAIAIVSSLTIGLVLYYALKPKNKLAAA